MSHHLAPPRHPARRGTVAALCAAPAALLVAVTAALVPAVPAVAATETPPPGEKITVDLVTVNGSGCPAGSVAASVPRDNTTFEVRYEKFTVVADQPAPGTSTPPKLRKNCQLALWLHVPHGFGYEVYGVDFRGGLHLGTAASTAELSFNHYVQNTPRPSMYRTPFAGPRDGEWTESKRVEIEIPEKPSPCDQRQSYFNINVELALTSAGGQPVGDTISLVNPVDPLTGTAAPAAVYHLRWVRCPK